MPRTCSIDGCTNQHEARGWCPNHYYRWRRYGDPEGTPVIRWHSGDGPMQVPLSQVEPDHQAIALQSQRRFDTHPITVTARAGR